MHQRAIGILLIIVALVIAGGTYYAKQNAEMTINVVVNATGSCFLNDGTCLHNQETIYTTIGWVISVILFLVGLYLVVFDRTATKLAAHERKIEAAVEKVEKVEKASEKDAFETYLAAFQPQEQLILKAIREQDGILQSTLRYRVGMGKATLSLKLAELEKKGIISRKEKGKTNQIFLRKRF
jgi:uncharacterized membrane protein